MEYNAEKRDKRDVRSTLKSESATCRVRNISIVICRERAVVNYDFLQIIYASFCFCQVPRKKLMHNIMQYSGGATTDWTCPFL